MATERKEARRWYYHLPHDNEPTFLWEDVYLLPDVEGSTGGSLWLTIDALGPEDRDPEDRSHFEVLLASRDFHLNVETLDMCVRSEFLSEETLPNWIRLALQELGLPCDELIEGPREMFEGTNEHSIHVAAAIAKAAELEGNGPPDSSTKDSN